MQGVDIAPYFTKEYFERKAPVWQDADEWNSLGEANGEGYVPPRAFQSPSETQQNKNAAKIAAEGGNNSFRNFIVGLLLGVFAYLLVVNREKVIGMAKSLSSSNKGVQ